MPEPIQVQPDAEVADVLARLRQLPAGEIRLIVPPGASLAESRFNFQLLAMHAAERGQRVVVESDEERAVAFAAEAGLGTRDGAQARFAESSLPEGTPAPPAPLPLTTPPAPVPAAVDDAEYADYVEYDDGGFPDEGPVDLEAPGQESPEEPPEATASPERRGGPWRPVPPVESAGRRPAPRGRRRLLLYGAAGAILLIGIVAVVLLVPSATVTITSPSKPFSLAVDLTAQPGRGAVSVRAQSIQKQASGTFQSTGQNDIPGAKAAGTIQFQDHCPGPPLQIQQGAILSTQSGAQFVQQQPITIADRETKTAPIQAQSVGAGGNVAAGQITTLQNEGVYASCLKVTNPQPTTGGQDAKQQPVITQQDLSNAQSQLQQQVEQTVQAQLAAAARAGEKEADQNPVVWGTPDFTADHAKGSTVQSFNASLTLKGTSAYYRPAQVVSAFRAELQSKVPAGQQLTPNDFTAEYATTGGGVGHLEFKGEAVGRVAPRLNLNAIRSHIAGSSAGATESYLKGLPVSSSSVAQSPFPLPLLPFLSSRISIHYVIQQPAAPAPAPSASASVAGH